MFKTNDENSQSKSVNQVKGLRYCWRFIKPYKRELFTTLIALTLAALTILGFGRVLMHLVDLGFGEEQFVLLNKSIIMMIGVVGMLAIASFVRTYTTAWLAEKVVNEIKQTLFSHTLKLDQYFYEKNRVGEILSCLNADTTLIRTLISGSAAVAVRSVIQVVGALILLVITSPGLTGMVLVIVPAVLIPLMVLGKRVRYYSGLVQAEQGKMTAQAEEDLNGITTIQAMTIESDSLKKFQMAISKKMHLTQKRVFFRSLLIGSVIFFVFASVAGVIWMGGRDVLTGALSPGELTAFIYYAIIAAGGLNNMTDVIGEMQSAAGAMDRIVQILSVAPKIQDPLTPIKLETTIKGKIEFKEVTFTYPTRTDVKALESFSITINPGEHIAIVGPSGAGKSTLFGLLLRFYDPNSGKILFNGIDSKQMQLEAMRSRIGLVPQDPCIFNGTIKENILIGKSDASDSDVLKAAQDAHLDEFIQSLDKGYHTQLGDKGILLSGGQKQRVAIARALLRKPEILLLDEATNALDALSEHHVQNALKETMQGRTTLVIAHRLSTVMNADRILVIKEGKILAEGKHSELMEASSLYQELVEKQFQVT